MDSWKKTAFGREYADFRAEFAAWYALYPADVSAQEARLEARLTACPQANAFARKVWVYEEIAGNCPVKIFRHYPFYFEVVTGAPRNLLGSAFPPVSGLGSWVMRSDRSGLAEDFEAFRKPPMDAGILYSTLYADLAHNAAGVETILNHGFAGMRERAKAALAAGQGDADFLRAAIAACDCVARLGERFAQEAEVMLERETDESIRARLARIAVSARRCPLEGARTFFEALNTILYLKELGNVLDSAGVAILGHVDRLLWPYLQRDLASGEITPEEARDLLYWFCAFTDAKWDLHDAVYGTNTSINIGGCDRDGTPVFNPVTEWICAAYLDLRLVNPKLQARFAPGADDAYFALIARVASSGLNVLSIFNDRVIIQAQTRMGKALEDSRLYVNGGCQEVLLAETELNSRAICYLNPARYLEMLLLKNDDGFFARERILPPTLERCNDFAEFSRRVFRGLALIINAIAWHYNTFERRWPQNNPLPFLSATNLQCLERGRDLTQGGALYNDSSFALVGLSTFIDSMRAIERTVFEEKRFTLEQLCRMLRADFAGFEAERAYLQNRVDKYGSDDDSINAFARQMIDGVATAMADMPNARGGYYEASVWSFYGYEWMRQPCGASANGRHAGERLSRGINPSESTHTGIAAMIHAFSALDLTAFAQAAVAYFTLPLSLGKDDDALCEHLIRYFLEMGGSAADFDLLDESAIADALVHPEAHGDLVVRVCGYSARFVDLEPQMQREIAQRYQRN